MFSNELEAGGESIAEFLTPWDAIGSGQAFVDQIEDHEEQQRLVRFLMRRAFLQRRGADVERVEAFDGRREGQSAENGSAADMGESLKRRVERD